jgi:hypothetical protein
MQHWVAVRKFHGGWAVFVSLCRSDSVLEGQDSELQELYGWKCCIFQGASKDLALQAHTCHGSFLVLPDLNMVDNSPMRESEYLLSTINNQSELATVHL